MSFYSATHRRFAAALVVIATLTYTCSAFADEAPGLEVGKKAPDVKLKDQTGKEYRLADLLKEDQMLAVVFHRSADW